MPMYEYECIKCRKNVEDSVKALEAKADKETITALVDKYENINYIQLVDLKKQKTIAKYGTRDKSGIDFDHYIAEGDKVVIFNTAKYRFSELIYDKDDEKNVKCYCGERKQVERVISSFAYTHDLSTNMPKPDMGNMPEALRGKYFIGDYIEEKDRPKKNR